MTKDQIIAAAKEAGLFIGSDDNPAVALWWYPEVERFAAIIAKAEREYQAKSIQSCGQCGRDLANEISARVE